MAFRVLLVTDVVDSVGQLARLGDTAAHAAMQQHFTALRACLAQHAGSEVKTLGDGLLARFDGTVEALECAVAMQVAAAGQELILRIGIDAGEPIEVNGDVAGTPTVVATRLCAEAAPGEILVSGVVRSLAEPRFSRGLSPRGPLQLKGFPEPMKAWSVEGSEQRPRDERISVVIVDDQALVRRGFRVIIDSEPGLVVVGEASDGDEALDVVTRVQPDVVLMDIRMPHVNGLDAARSVLDRTSSRVIILTTFDADEYVYRTLRMGASGFLLKDAPPERLFAAIRCAHSGEALIDPAVTQRLIAGFARPVAEPLPDLTGREVEVLRLMAKGMSNAEIAQALFVEESTVKTHVARVLVKLGARDRLQAVVHAYESGFVRVGS